jgi:MFS family permease
MSVREALGLNRAAVAVLAVIGCLGLAEEIWSNFLALHLQAQTGAAQVGNAAGAVAEAAFYMGVIASLKNLLEGVAYIGGGSVAHRMGPRVALTVSALPMVAGISVMFLADRPWAIAAGALLMTNWEPLSVPATFEIVGSEVPKNRRTTAFAVQSIQKRLPKVLGPAIGGLAFAAIGYWLNLTLAFALVGLAIVLQLTLLSRMRPRADPQRVPFRAILSSMPAGLRQLLTAEIFIRWGDWFARDFAVLYVVSILTRDWGFTDAEAARTAGWLLSLMALTALATYIPTARWVDRSASPQPFIATTFLLFALFPICLVVLPKASAWLGVPVMAALVVTFVVNGLREFGEPARKSLITAGFPPEHRARGVGLYWGVRSFAFFPAPFVAALLWRTIGPDATFLIGGCVGLAGTALYVSRGLKSAQGSS